MLRIQIASMHSLYVCACICCIWLADCESFSSAGKVRGVYVTQFFALITS